MYNNNNTFFWELHNSDFSKVEFTVTFFFEIFFPVLTVLVLALLCLPSCHLRRRHLLVLEEILPCLPRQKLLRSQRPNVSYRLWNECATVSSCIPCWRTKLIAMLNRAPKTFIFYCLQYSLRWPWSGISSKKFSQRRVWRSMYCSCWASTRFGQGESNVVSPIVLMCCIEKFVFLKSKFCLKYNWVMIFCFF